MDPLLQLLCTDTMAGLSVVYRACTPGLEQFSIREMPASVNRRIVFKASALMNARRLPDTEKHEDRYVIITRSDKTQGISMQQPHC